MTLKERFLALFNGGKKPEDLSEDELAQFATIPEIMRQRAGSTTGLTRNIAHCQRVVPGLLQHLPGGSGNAPALDVMINNAWHVFIPSVQLMVAL